MRRGLRVAVFISVKSIQLEPPRQGFNPIILLLLLICV